MFGLNRVILLGNLGSDVELHFTHGGNAVLNLRLATTETYLDRDKQRQERTEWHSVAIFGKRAEALSKLLRRGMPLLVEGRLQTSTYEDRDGNKRYRTDVIAQEVLLCGRAPGPRDPEEGAGAGPSGPRAPRPAPGDVGDEGADPAEAAIPFITSAPGRWGL